MRSPHHSIQKSFASGLLLFLLACILAPQPGSAVEFPPTLASFDISELGGDVQVNWTTAYERDTAGFFLERQSLNGYLKVNSKMLPAVMQFGRGRTYSIVDRDALIGVALVYRLLEISTTGAVTVHGPFEAIAEDSKMDRPPLLSSKPMASPEILPASVPISSPGSEMKIIIEESSLYFLSASNIAEALVGSDEGDMVTAISSSNIAITCQSEPVAWYPQTNNLGLFFYGERIESFYTTKNVYWLTVGPGAVMPSVQGYTNAPADTNLTFRETIHLEEDVLALTSIYDDPEGDFWAWKLLHTGMSDTLTFNETIHWPAAGVVTQARFTARMLGGTDLAVAIDHTLETRVNGTLIGTAEWGGKTQYETNFSFPQDLLTNGVNVITFTDTLAGGPSFSVEWIESMDISYQRPYLAVSNSLHFRGDTNPVVSISGFTSSNILAMDITDPRNPQWLKGSRVDDLLNGFYRLSVAPMTSSNRYLAIAREAVLDPPAASGRYPSTISMSTNRADYLVITRSDLAGALDELLRIRQAQGLETMVVDIEDIYDTYSHGLADPHAITSFLAFAYSSWDLPPRYVLLAGNGTYDPRDNEGQGDCVIPTMLMKTPYDLSSSDRLFVDFDNDKVPEIAVGRLPVTTSNQLQQEVNKIILHLLKGRSNLSKPPLILKHLTY